MIRFLLLHRIEWTDAHPRLMLGLTIAAMCLASAIDPSVPQ
jgi:hypothetical protein